MMSFGKEGFAPDILLCAGDAAEKISLFGRELEVRLFSAYDAAMCIKEAGRLAEQLEKNGIDDGYALAEGAAICHKCLYDGLGRVFESAQEALVRLTAEEIGRVTSVYGELRHTDFDIETLSKKDFDRIKSSIESSPLERMRWKVLRALGMMPGDAAAKKMTDGQYLYCYINLLIDGEMSDAEQGINESFSVNGGFADE